MARTWWKHRENASSARLQILFSLSDTLGTHTFPLFSSSLYTLLFVSLRVMSVVGIDFGSLHSKVRRICSARSWM